MAIHELEVKNADKLACVKYGATTSEGWLRAGNDFIRMTQFGAAMH
jgi:hypothetical protein